MKKLLTLTSILAAGTMIANAANTIELTSKVTGAGTYATTYDATDAWATTYGQTTATVTATTPFAGDKTSDLSATWVAALYGKKTNNTSSTAAVKSYTLLDLWGAEAIASAKTVNLLTLAFVTATTLTADTAPTGVYVQIVDNSGNVLGTSTSAISYTYNTDSSNTAAYGCGSVSFSNLQVSTNDSFSVKFVTKNADDTYSANTSSVGYAIFNMSLSGSNGYAVDGITGLQPVIKVGVSLIPEPSFFGLFAGTLALGLAGTRRRRRCAK